MKILGTEIRTQNEREERLARMVSEKVDKCMEEDRGMPSFTISADIGEIMAFNQCMFTLGMVDYMQHSRINDNLQELQLALHKERQSAAGMHPLLRQEIGKALRQGEGSYYVGQGEIPSATLQIIKDECYSRGLESWVDFLHPDYDMIINPEISKKVDMDALPEKSKGRNMESKEIRHGAHM